MAGWDEVVDDLYGGALDDFVARRDSAVRAARAAKDRDLAGRIASLRKPSQAAWAVNLLVRDDPSLAGTLRDLGEGLRDAERSLDGPALRELGRQRRALVAGLVGQARRLASAAGQRLSPSAGQEVERTLTAALADPQVAQAVAAGTLTRGTEYVGFGGATAGPREAGTHEEPDGSSTGAGPAHGAAEEDGPAAARSTSRTEATARGGGAASRSAKGRSGDGGKQSLREQEREVKERREEERREKERERLRRRHELATAAREAAEREAERLRTRHDDAADAERRAVVGLEDAERASREAYAAEEELVRALADVRRRLAEARAALPRADEALVAARGSARAQEKAVRSARRELDRATSALERAREQEADAAHAVEAAG